MTLLARLHLGLRLILRGLDEMCRRPLCASPAPSGGDPEPTTVHGLLGLAEPPVRVLRYVLADPDRGVLLSLEAGGAGYDAAPDDEDICTSWERPRQGRLPSGALMFASEDDARRLMWSAPWAIPDETEIVPVVVRGDTQ
ncbi:MAG: hypothetical protein IT374_26195 [Polyangiaceae bacterium]|nr:hypothetical protein [Polyangiaceae bacterium]